VQFDWGGRPFLRSRLGRHVRPQAFRRRQADVRVTNPRGRVVMGNWIPNDPTFVSEGCVPAERVSTARDAFYFTSANRSPERFI